MGVSGCGKTTIGKLIAHKLQLPFYDADDFHPDSNKEKMSKGHPLDDDDRAPWLQILSLKLNEWANKSGAVLACSALKESYRKILNEDKEIHWIYLDGNYDLINERLKDRHDHFFDQGLLASQFETLEVPNYGMHINIEAAPKDIIKSIVNNLNKHA